MSDPPPVPEVTTDTLRAALARGESVHVLDIRPRDEFEAWHVPGSRHIGGYEALKDGAEDVYADRSVPTDAPVVTVCGAGGTSRAAARRLRAQGADAYSLKGGLRAWSVAWNTATMAAPDADATIVQVRRTGKGCLSYLIGSAGEAVVVDPALSPAVYEAQADDRDWALTGVLDTHVHADHLSRARRLADAVDAPLYLPKQERVTFDHVPLTDGATVEVGSAPLEALRTPGHTPESTTYRLGRDALLTGDTLFVEGVGCPDLDADAAEGRRKARQLYRSLQRLTRRSGNPTVLPGHASAPVPFDSEVVGAPLSAVTDEVALLGMAEEAFVDRVTADVPETPPNHDTIIAANTTGDWPAEEAVVDLEAGANRCAIG